MLDYLTIARGFLTSLRFVRNDGGLTRERREEDLEAKPPNPLLSPCSSFSVVIPSAAHVVCEVEESPGYGVAPTLQRCNNYLPLITINH